MTIRTSGSPSLLFQSAQAFVVFFLICLWAAPATAKKTDVVTMDSGKKFVGEIKKMEFGLLDFSMDEVRNRLDIKWNQVAGVTSTKQLAFDLSNGDRLFGSLVAPSSGGMLRIQTNVGEFEVPISEVVVCEPIKSSFSRRFSADISTGVSFVKSTDILQLNFGGSARYRTTKALTQMTFNSFYTTTDDETSSNGDFPVTHYRFFKGAWFYRGDLSASHNDELGIDFRGTVGGGFGNRLVHSNQAMVTVSTLLLGNREYTNDDSKSNFLELVLDTGLLMFRYDSPKLEFYLRLTGFLNLTTWGRYRINSNARFSFELFKDLFWDLGQLYYRYDSDPSDLASSKSDWGIVSGLRLKYN